MPEEQNQRGLTGEQKTGLVLLSIFAFLAVALGFLQIRNTMYKSFALNKSLPPTVEDSIDPEQALHYRDTDLDGLNDFDELYVYSTSPYLADTDSDGIPDKVEVDRGTNPNCPEGKDCTGFSAGALPAATTSFGSSLGLVAPVPPANLEVSAILHDPTEVRKMLLNAGVSSALLDKVTDAELLKMVDQIFSTTTIALTTSSAGIDYGKINQLNSLVATGTKK